MALHASARQLARHGRIRTRRSRVAMSGSPHRRQANTRPRSYRMAGPPQQAPRQSRLAIHNRQRPRQAEETVPSVRVTRATSLALIDGITSGMRSGASPSNAATRLTAERRSRRRISDRSSRVAREVRTSPRVGVIAGLARDIGSFSLVISLTFLAPALGNAPGGLG